MITLHSAADRFHTRIAWLDSWHSFSFGEHYDPQRMGFGSLRVINDDCIAGGGGFPTHGHRDMEILTWVLAGAVRHRDSSGGEGEIRPGELQRMRAGRGIRHSEFNAAADQPLHLLQIWIEPAVTGLEPGYAQHTFPVEGRRNRFQWIADRHRTEGALDIVSPMGVQVADLEGDVAVRRPLAPGTRAWLHLATGSARVAGHTLQAGDAVSLIDETELVIQGSQAQALLFTEGF